MTEAPFEEIRDVVGRSFLKLGFEFLKCRAGRRREGRRICDRLKEKCNKPVLFVLGGGVPVWFEDTECGESCNNGATVLVAANSEQRAASSERATGNEQQDIGWRRIHTLSVESTRSLLSKVGSFWRRQTTFGDSLWHKLWILRNGLKGKTVCLCNGGILELWKMEGEHGDSCRRDGPSRGRFRTGEPLLTKTGLVLDRREFGRGWASVCRGDWLVFAVGLVGRRRGFLRRLGEHFVSLLAYERTAQTLEKRRHDRLLLWWSA